MLFSITLPLLLGNIDYRPPRALLANSRIHASTHNALYRNISVTQRPTAAGWRSGNDLLSRHDRLARAVVWCKQVPAGRPRGSPPCSVAEGGGGVGAML